MEQRTFNLIDAICREGLGNDVWGVADGGNTKDLFGCKGGQELDGMFLYVYVDEEKPYPYLNRIDADLIVLNEDGAVIRLYKLK